MSALGAHEALLDLATQPTPLPARLSLSWRAPVRSTMSSEWWVYSCPWCSLEVSDANSMAVAIMERHLDRHVAAGDHERPALRVVV